MRRDSLMNYSECREGTHGVEIESNDGTSLLGLYLYSPTCHQESRGQIRAHRRMVVTDKVEGAINIIIIIILVLLIILMSP